MEARQPVALVTGANRGIGLAIAHGLVKRGFHVWVAARRSADAGAACARIGGDTTAVELDLSDALLTEAHAQALLQDHGAVDVLVNNAAVLIPGRGFEVETSDLVTSLNINVAAPSALIRIFGARMKDAGYGRIVNVSSGWGAFDEGMSGPTAYSVSKAALNAVTLAWAPVLGSAVKINAACPGWVRTRMGGQDAPRSPDEGADTPLWLATLPDDGPTGGFFRDRRRIEW